MPAPSESVNPSGPPSKRSRLVSFVAWLSIIGGALGVLGAAPIVLTQTSTRTMVILFDAVCSFIAGLGLRVRREWARRAFIFVLAYSSLMAIVGALRFRAPAVSQFPGQPGGSAPPLTQQQLDAIAAQMRPMFVVMACVTTLISGLLIVWLRTQRIRDEFNPDVAPQGLGHSDIVESVAAPQPAVTVRAADRASRTGWPPIS